MKNDAKGSGGKNPEAEGTDMPTRNNRKNLNLQAGSGNSDSKPGLEGGYTGGEKIGPSGGKDTMKIRQQNPNRY
jgi:hypothetical protein